MTSSPAPSPPSGPGSTDIEAPQERQVSRIAELQLRSAAGPLPTRVYWPTPSGDARRPGLLVFFPGVELFAGDLSSADRLCRELCAGVGLVVLSVGHRVDASEGISETAFDDATTATQWAADHARELHADPRRLLVGGAGFGADLTIAVARHAREQGWPPIALQVLVSPEQAAAPATLVEQIRRSLEVDGDD
jgi:acetyl esterase